MIPEDYGMLHFQRGRLNPRDFWHEAPERFGEKTGTDLFIGRDSYEILQRLALADIAVDYVVVDPGRVPRDTFAEILEAWKDGYTESIAEYSRFTREEVGAYLRSDDCRHPESAAVCRLDGPGRQRRSAVVFAGHRRWPDGGGSPMRMLKPLFVSSAVLIWSVVALAQDPVKVDSAHYKLVWENAAVRLLKIDYAPGGKSVMHQHPDAIAVLLSAAKMRFTTPDGKSEDLDRPTESALYTPAGTHNPANIGSTPLSAILVEFKTPAPGKAALPTSRPGMEIKTLAEGPRAMAYRATADASFTEPAGTKHEFDQIVIALGAGEMSLAIDGKPAKTKWARGDAVFIGRNVAHESKNLTGKPVDFVIVAVK